jgi:hypothetical protein
VAPQRGITHGQVCPFNLYRAILKRSLFVKNAWEIGENDLGSAVINKDDSPVIPEGIVDLPVLKVLNKKNKP